MSISKIAFAIPLSLGLACSTTGQSYSGGAWTERIATDGSMPGDPPVQGAAGAPSSASVPPAAPSGSQDGLVVQPAAGSTPDGSTWAASDRAGSSGSSGSTGSSGSGPGGAMGSGGSSETMGSGSSDQGTAGSGSSDQAQQGATAGPGNTGAHEGDQHVMGKVSKVSDEEISIKPKSGQAKTLKINQDTTVSINGKDAKPSQLKQGQQVRASFENVSGDDVAVKIEVGKARKAQGRMKGGSR
jgi:hypothetical protein